MDTDISLTPLSLINSLGAFDFDPCGVEGHPTAARINQLPIDGLSIPWEGRVWCNPPYSKPLQWVRRLAEHGNGVALVLASTDTSWFQEYLFGRADALLFLKGRPKFTRLDGSVFGIMRAVCLASYGAPNSEAIRRASEGPLPGCFITLKEAA